MAVEIFLCLDSPNLRNILPIVEKSAKMRLLTLPTWYGKIITDKGPLSKNTLIEKRKEIYGIISCGKTTEIPEGKRTDPGGAGTGDRCVTAVYQQMGMRRVTHIKTPIFLTHAYNRNNESRECTENLPSHALSAFCFLLWFIRQYLLPELPPEALHPS